MPDPLVTVQNDAKPALSATSDLPAPAPTPAPDPVPPDPSAGEPAAPTTAPQESSPSSGPEAPPEPPEPPPAEPAPPARDRNRFGERLSELTQQRRQAEQRADRLAESLEKALEALNRVTVPPVPVGQQASGAPPERPEPRPSRVNFDDPEGYDAALIEWSTRQATRLATAEFERRAAEQRAVDERMAAEQRQREQIQRTQEAWQERKAQAIERYPDYVEVAEADDVPISTSMALIISDSETGPDIAYHLGKHPDEARRIAAMVVPGQFFPAGHPAAGEPIPDLHRQVFELGRIAAIAAAPRPEVTRAPQPIRPLGSNNSARPKSRAEMTPDEYAAVRMPELQAERRPGMIGIPADLARRRQ